MSASLRGTGVATCTVIGFPHGTTRSTVKAIEATACAKQGADEIDIVAFLPFLINYDVTSAKAELMEIVRAARAVRSDIVIKVIVESAVLVKLASGPVLLSGDLYHSREAREKRGVPPFNTSREQTLQSMDVFEKLAKTTGAKVVIQHEPRDISLLPAFPQAAK